MSADPPGEGRLRPQRTRLRDNLREGTTQGTATPLGRADLIVSGDPHLTNLDAIRRGDGGIISRVLTPRAFLDKLDRGV